MAKVTLKVLVAATLSETGFMYATEKDVAELVKHGFAELNTRIANPAKPTQFAVRASEAGLQAQRNAEVAANQVDTGKDGDEDIQFTVDNDDDEFEILNEPMPAATRAPRASKYPFDKLEPGQSFRVLDTKVASGNAHSAMSSALNNANKRWSTEVEGEFEEVSRGKFAGKQIPKRIAQRKFEQRRVDGGTQIYRVL